MVGSECRDQYVHIRNHRSAASRRDRLQEPSMPGRKPPRRGETGNGVMTPPRGAVERRRRTSPSSTTAASVVRSLAACARAWASNSSRISTVAFTMIIVPRIPPRNYAVFSPGRVLPDSVSVVPLATTRPVGPAYLSRRAGRAARRAPRAGLRRGRLHRVQRPGRRHSQGAGHRHETGDRPESEDRDGGAPGARRGPEVLPRTAASR